MFAPNPDKISANTPKRYVPVRPLFVIASRLTKKSKNPIEILGRAINILILKNKKPKNIKIKGAKKDIPPKFLSKLSLILIRNAPFLVKDKRSINPVTIKPKEKIE
jgi:hypothetical protein